MTEQENLMRRLQVQGFVLMDTGLYLDTHPNDKKALDYHNRYSGMYQQTKTEYERRFGPITMGVNDGNSWTWVETPWPWEGSAL